MNVAKSSQISNIGKFLDQPKLLKKLNKAMPPMLIGGAVIIGGKDVFDSPKKNRKKSLIRNICTLGAVVGTSLVAVKGLKINGKKVITGLLEAHDHGHKHHHKNDLKKEIDKFIPQVEDKKIIEILNKAKDKVLSLGEVTKLRNETNKSVKGEKLFNKIIPKGHDHASSKHIFQETGRLSLLGLVPIVGGVAGGTLGDKLTDKNWKKKFPDKIKEGFYQYFANIFLCNVGAGSALLGLETLSKNKIIKPPSQNTKLGAMIGGVLSVGILGGSAIANYLGQKVINPVFDKKHNKGLYHERTPDPLDVSLHVDDMASVGVLSGFKWVEPALPILYSISGYRAGIGYRNNGHNHIRQRRGPHNHNKNSLNFEHHHNINNKIFEKFKTTESN